MSRALGRYELLRPLARGGMAEVFLARRRSAGVEKWLVVKRMRPERIGDTQFLDLFMREARLSMSLAHQNIVPVFDFGRIDDQVFLAMERVEGRDLGSSLARAGAADPARPLPPLVAAFIAAECCQALDYAHHRRSPDGTALGIVHRDVTPRNVLLSWSGEVKLTDFGIAALAGDPTVGVRVIGTPAYMAPEQARGEPTDPRADVYAIGLVLREALTGVRARAGADRETLLACARRGELVDWAASDAPPALVDIVARATATDPGQRYPDARSMAGALDAFIVGERAARRGESPARLLAGWLAALWDGEITEPAADGDAIEAHLLSFIDDGALGVIGTGTERSMAATAAAKPEGGAMARRRGRGIAIAIGAAVVAAMVAIVVARRAPAQRVATPNPTPNPTSTPTPNPTPTPTPNPNPNPTAVALAAPSPVDPRPSPRPRRPVTVAAVATPHRSVTINSRPWANFTIDADPTAHQTVETISLPAGAHILHFTNPPLHLSRDFPFDVPPDHDLKLVVPLADSP